MILNKIPLDGKSVFLCRNKEEIEFIVKFLFSIHPLWKRISGQSFKDFKDIDDCIDSFQSYYKSLGLRPNTHNNHNVLAYSEIKYYKETEKYNKYNLYDVSRYIGEINNYFIYTDFDIID